MAVYTEVSDDDLVSFIAEYDVGAVVSYKGIAEGVENSNYLLRTDQGTFILTLYEKRVDPEDLPFFLTLMEHLAGHDIAAPTPIKGRDGNSLRRLGGRPAALFTFLDGMWPRRINPDHCAAVGEGVARLHLAAADFTMTRPNALSLASWRPLLDAAAERAHQIQPGLAEELAEELDALEAGWPTDLPRGIIHADLFPDNVFFLGQRLSGFIDFYFACTDFLAYDLAVCLNAWCFEGHRTFNVTKAKRMITGYRRVRAISDDELAALPMLARGSAIRFLLTRLYDWLNTPADAMVTRKDPLEFLEKLRFHRTVKGPGDYGLD